MGQSQTIPDNQTTEGPSWYTGSFLPDDIPDADKLFADALKDEPEALRGIRGVVGELQGSGGSNAPEPAEIPEAIKKQNAKATKKAEDQADSWLKKQLQRQQIAPRVDESSECFAAPPPIQAIQAWKPSSASQSHQDTAATATTNKQVPLFYALLGLSTVDATFEEIKKGYRVQALRWHPDKNRDRLEKATERFQQINEAFDTLYDAEKREQYDSGQLPRPQKAKKLQGHGWSNLLDEDEAVLSKQGLRYRLASWQSYWNLDGRIDDDPDQLVRSKDDPRYPQERIKIFWRYIGEMAYMARESGSDTWLRDFVMEVWKDTPSRWPKATQLQEMNDVSQQEWKERRMVYNRRKHKVLLHIELHEHYLAIPGREEKEKARLMKLFPRSFANAEWNV